MDSDIEEATDATIGASALYQRVVLAFLHRIESHEAIPAHVRKKLAEAFAAGPPKRDAIARALTSDDDMDS